MVWPVSVRGFVMKSILQCACYSRRAHSIFDAVMPSQFHGHFGMVCSPPNVESQSSWCMPITVNNNNHKLKRFLSSHSYFTELSRPVDLSHVLYAITSQKKNKQTTIGYCKITPQNTHTRTSVARVIQSVSFWKRFHCLHHCLLFAFANTFRSFSTILFFP